MRERHVLSELDRLRLRELLVDLRASGRAHADHVALLGRRLREARVVEQQHVPRDVITMNSMLAVRDLEVGERWRCTLAYPQDADLLDRRVSVALPLGAMLLGQRVGDTVACPAGSGERRLRIERLYYQPEASGHFHL
jgi:regulator of nucleoside diphosphate kinase